MMSLSVSAFVDNFFIFLGVILIIAILIIILILRFIINKIYIHFIAPMSNQIEERGKIRVFEDIESLKLSTHALHNFEYTRDDKAYAEIDAIIICPKGIIVIDVKDYGGKIYGNSNNKYWKQYLSKTAELFNPYNPIWHNDFNIQTISDIVDKKDISYFSVILFGDSSKLHISVSNPKVFISKIKHAKKIIRNILKSNNPDCLTVDEIDKALSALVNTQTSSLK